MKSLQLNVPVVDLDQKPIENTTLAILLAQALIASTKGDAIKYLDWAIELKHKGEIAVDNSDFETLKNFITNDNPNMTNLAKGQLLKALAAAPNA